MISSHTSLAGRKQGLGMEPEDLFADGVNGAAHQSAWIRCNLRALNGREQRYQPQETDLDLLSSSDRRSSPSYEVAMIEAGRTENSLHRIGYGNSWHQGENDTMYTRLHNETKGNVDVREVPCTRATTMIVSQSEL